MLTPFLTAEEQEFLQRPERLNVGPYHPWGPDRASRPFIVDIDARPLAVLAEEASRGSRLYEFMAMRRPGDVLHYLWLDFVDIGEDLPTYTKTFTRSRDSLCCDGESQLAGLPFAEFDGRLAWRGDDTQPFEERWCSHRDTNFWPDKTNRLLDLVRRLQARLREIDDFLLQHELGLIDQMRHRRDYRAEVPRAVHLQVGPPPATTLHAELFDLIMTLAGSRDIQSISCPLSDYALWRALVAEQVRRAMRTGLAPQQALGLSGPDGGLPLVADRDWGGEVHIPCEGACEGDLFINPKWRKFDPEAADRRGSLRAGTGGKCGAYFLVQRDYGELKCATRAVCGDWILYQDRSPSAPSNPFA